MIFVLTRAFTSCRFRVHMLPPAFGYAWHNQDFSDAHEFQGCLVQLECRVFCFPPLSRSFHSGLEPNRLGC